MLRFGFNQYGGPDVFTELTAPVPEPKANQVLIKTTAFGINPYDVKLRHGDFQNVRALKLPFVPGTELAGIVEAVGADVTDFTVGDRVMNYRPRGGYSEYVTASANKVAHVPDKLPLTVAAGMPNAGIAAYGVMQLLNVERGKTIIIEGASGAVGTILIQAAKYRGLNVLATCSSRNHDLVLRLGADQVALYDRENVAARFANMGDYVVNAVGGGNDAGAWSWMRRPGGVYVTLNEPETRPANDPDFHVLGDNGPTDVQAAFAFLTELRTRAELYINIAAALPFSLTGVTTAHAELTGHHPAGKFICTKEPDFSTHLQM
jgi:NADPH:quinone reductase-like Zn-dependent oxidoreductase